MSETPPMSDSRPLNGRDRTPELTSKREKRSRDDPAEDDPDRSRSRSHRHRHRDHDENPNNEDVDEERERRHRHRHRDREDRDRHDEDDEERRERRRRREHRDRENETEEEREERRRRRKEKEERERRDRGSRDGSYRGERGGRDRSRESHRSHRSRDVRGSRDGRSPVVSALKEMTREEKEAERERRDREMQEERREAARLRDERFAEMDRERDRERRMSRPERPYSPRNRRQSPTYDLPPPPPPPRSPPPRDPVTSLLDEVDSESRSIFVSQLAARLTSSDLGLFFEDKLGRGSVRDARVVMDKGSRRSKGIGYVELDDVGLVNRALALSGTVVMGIPINIMLTEAERNREGQAAAAASGSFTFGARPAPPPGTFPPLSTGLAVPPGVDVDAHKDATIPYHRLLVSNLAFSLGPNDIKAVFESFGDIEFVDQHFNFSGESKGSAYVQFKELRAAQMALDAMNNFDLAGRPIRVQSMQERTAYVPEVIEETGYAPRMDAAQRQQLMFKLARTDPPTNHSLSAPRTSAPTKNVSMSPTYYLVVSNMFNPEEETERNWDLDLAEDIKGEVESKYGKLRRIKVDKMSAGEVYLEFDSVGAAQAALKGLNGRFFGGRQLAASFITEALFKAHM